MPKHVKNNDIYICSVIASSIINHPNNTPKIGVKKEKELVLLAEYFDMTHNQPINPKHIITIT